MKLKLYLFALIVLFASSASYAQRNTTPSPVVLGPRASFSTELPYAENPSGNYVPLQVDAYGNLYVTGTGGGGGGGGGGGAVTAASGSYVDGSIVTLGTKADTAYAGSGSASDIAILKGIYSLDATGNTLTNTINTTLGNPFQAGGNIGNTSFGATATLGAFADGAITTLGTTADSAYAGTGSASDTAILKGLYAVESSGNSLVSTTNTKLGNPFQAGGSIGNTSFGSTAASGAFVDGAITTLGTKADTAYAGSGSASDIAILKGIYSLDATGNTLTNTLITNLGNPFQAGGSIGNTTFGATAASGAFVDGALATLGTKADTAWSGTGSGSEIAIEKSIYGALSGTLNTTGNANLQVGSTAVSTSNPVPEVSALTTATTTTDFGPTNVSTTSTTLVPATTGARARWLVQLVAATNGATATCRADGGTAVSLGAGWTLSAQFAGIGWTAPGAGQGAVNCICSAASSCTLSGEYVQ